MSGLTRRAVLCGLPAIGGAAAPSMAVAAPLAELPPELAALMAAARHYAASNDLMARLHAAEMDAMRHGQMCVDVVSGIPDASRARQDFSMRRMQLFAAAMAFGKTDEGISA